MSARATDTQDCEKAIALEPGFIKAYIRKGNALAGMKKHSEAVSAYNHALEIDANNQEAQEGITKCREVSGVVPFLMPCPFRDVLLWLTAGYVFGHVQERAR